MHTADGCWAAFTAELGSCNINMSRSARMPPLFQEDLCLLSPAGALHRSSSLTFRGQLVSFALPTRHRASCLCQPRHRFTRAGILRSPICRGCL